jgi:hypothetical protein
MAYGTVKVDNITFTNSGADQATTISGIYRAITSGVTVTGTISGVTIQGTTVSGTTVTGTTANFVSGVFTTQVSGATVTGTQSSFTSGNFVTLSGATATFTSGVIASGTAAAPSLSILGDPNTGIYSPGADQVAISTNGTGRLFIGSDGSVGIGTSSPAELLELSATTDPKIRFVDVGNVEAKIGISSSTALTFEFNGAERLRIDSSGRVGIGTSSPAQQLTIVNNSTSVATGSTLSVVGGTSNIAGEGGSIAFSNFVKAGTASAARIRSGLINALVQEAGYLAFDTNGGAGLTEQMRIDYTGDMSLGTTTTSLARLTIEKAFAGGTAIDTNTTTASTTYNAAVFRHNSTAVGQIAVSTTATSYITSSDYRLKENVTAVIDGITRLQQLKPSRFNFIADPNHAVDGFIAHEAQAVVPECVTGEKDAVDDDGNPKYQGIDQSKMVPLLTAALQEAVARIKILEDKVAALEGN